MSKLLAHIIFLPMNKNVTLPIKQLGPRHFLIDYGYRRPDGTVTHVKRIVYGTKIDAVAAFVEIARRIQGKARNYTGPFFPDLVDLVLKKNSGAGMPSVYAAIRKHFENVHVGDSFQNEYDEYIDELEDADRAINTIANHKSAIQTTLKYAKKKKKIKDVPITDFEIERTARDRTWNSEQERLKFFNTLIEKKSHLYWSMLLLELRPMRARSELWRLTDKNLVLFGKGAPYLTYLQAKTAARTEKETYIPLASLDQIMDYLQHGRPPGCPLLFPRLEGPIKSVDDFEGMRKCAWFPMGSPRRHFRTMCHEAEIVDLRIHDFKHIAMTHMIEVDGFSIERIMALGIQFTDKMIKKVYWKKNAIAALTGPVPALVVPDATSLLRPTQGAPSAAGNYIDI